MLKYGAAWAAIAGGAGAGLYYREHVYLHQQRKEAQQAVLAKAGLNTRHTRPLPTRAEQLEALARFVSRI